MTSNGMFFGLETNQKMWWFSEMSECPHLRTAPFLCIKSMRLHVYQESSGIAFFLSFVIYVLLIVAVAELGRIEALQLLRCGF